MKDQHIGFQVVGYPDEKGVGTPVIIAGAELGRKKVMAAWVAIKPGHKFPKGIKLAVLEERREADKAIFISETIADEQQAADELRLKRDKDAAQSKIDAAKKKSQIAAADKAMRDTATARDTANFELNSAKLDRDNASANANATEKDGVAFSDQTKKQFQKKLTDAEARLERAKKAFADSDKAWLDAKEERTKLNKQNLPA